MFTFSRNGCSRCAGICNIDRRLSIFETVAKNRRLSKEDIECRRSELSVEVVSDNEVSDLLFDLDLSPIP